MRARYLKAVLRQDVGYFDMHVTGTSEVIASVSSDTLVIQDVLSEKVKALFFLFYNLVKILYYLTWVVGNLSRSQTF